MAKTVARFSFGASHASAQKVRSYSEDAVLPALPLTCFRSRVRQTAAPVSQYYCHESFCCLGLPCRQATRKSSQRKRRRNTRQRRRSAWSRWPAQQMSKPRCGQARTHVRFGRMSIRESHKKCKVRIIICTFPPFACLQARRTKTVSMLSNAAMRTAAHKVTHDAAIFGTALANRRIIICARRGASDSVQHNRC